MPPMLPAPSATFAVQGVSSGLPAGVYYAVVTQRNPWGETLPSAELGPITVGANQQIVLFSTLLPGATTLRGYLTLVGGAPGSEIQFSESPTGTLAIPSTTGFGTPPTRSTAWLMD